VGGYTQRNPTAVMQGKPLPKDRRRRACSPSRGIR
jgi:hypothetical protein